MLILIGLLAALMVWLLLAPPLGSMKRGKASAALAEAYTLDQARKLSEMNPASLEYKLMASGMHWQSATFRIVSILAGVGGALALWAFLPGIPALAIGGLFFYIPTAWLNDKVKGRGREMDRHLPIAIGRISAGLLTGGSVADVMDEVASSMELEGKNPLSPELHLTAAELRSKERTEALLALAKRSPSISLSNLAYLLEGYIEAGGGKYAQVLAETSTRVQQILIARNRTQAKAGDAMLSAKVIPGVLALVVAYLAQDPMVQSSLRVMPVQIILGLTIGAMTLGYFLMRSMVMEAA
jgi:pilus assembly protein TadC